MADTKKESSGQFASQAVPMDQRMKTTSLFGAMSGFIFMTTSLQAGANMGFGGDFKTVLAAIAVGAVFLTVIAVVMGCAAAKTGMTFGQLINYAYVISQRTDRFCHGRTVSYYYAVYAV